MEKNYHIEVDHSKLETAAREVDNYVTLVKKQMRSAQGEVVTLSSSWQGSDFAHFKEEFDKTDDYNSVHAKMVQALESYSKYLRFAANEYKNKQANAVNRANRLPKF